MEEKKKDKNLRTANIRLTAKNKIEKENEKLGLKVGDIYEYTKDGIIDVLDTWCKTKPLNYYMIEHKENPENIHFHIVIEFKYNSQCRWSTLKNKFPYGYIDSCRKGVHQCVRYLPHIDNPEKHQYSWDDVVTNCPGRLERFKSRTKYSEMLYVNQISDKIFSGEIREFEVVNKIEPLLYVKYQTTFKRDFEFRKKMLLNDPKRNISVYVIQGPPRVGKSLFTRIWAKKHNKSICYSGNKKGLVENLMGQDCLVLDDLNFDDIPIEEMIKMLDPHVSTAISCRYYDKIFIGDTIFICTNIPVTSWYKNEDVQSRKALLKRIGLVLDFQDYKMKPQFRNSIVVYGEDKTTGEYRYMPFGENENEQLLQKGISCYTVNKIVDLNKLEDRDKANELMGKQEFDFDTMFTLLSVDDKVHHFDLNKYIDINADNTNVEEFIKQLDDM